MSDENQREQELEEQSKNTYENFNTNTNPGIEDDTELSSQKSTLKDPTLQQNSFYKEETGYSDSRNQDQFNPSSGNGYQGQPNYTNPNGYQGQSNYTNPNGYQEQPNYTNPNGYQEQPNYTNPNGYQGQSNYTNPNGYQGQPNYAYAREIPQPSEGLGIASLIIGIVTFILFCSCVNIPIAIVGIILGIVQLTKGGRKGLAITGIVLSSISIIAGIIFWISIFSNNEFRDALENADSLSYIEKSVDLPNYGIVEANFSKES